MAAIARDEYDGVVENIKLGRALCPNVEWSTRPTGARYNKSLDASGTSGLVIDNLSLTWLSPAASTQPLCCFLNVTFVSVQRLITMNDPIHEAANLLMGLCLKKLVEMARVRHEQVNRNWRIEFDGTKLQTKKLGAATTLDSNNQLVVYLPPPVNVEHVMFLIAHEAVHVAQICRGDYFPFFGFSVWKEQEYVSLPAEDPGYASQPWEAEAFELAPGLFEYLKTKASCGSENAT